MTDMNIAVPQGKDAVEIQVPDGNGFKTVALKPASGESVVRLVQLGPHAEFKTAWDVLGIATWGLGLLFIILFAAIVLFKLARGTIGLTGLISEDDGKKASLARFQALVFTFVVGLGVVMVMARTGQFPNQIPDNLLWILSGSWLTYLSAKGIQTFSGQTASENSSGPDAKPADHPTGWQAAPPQPRT